MGPPSYTQCIVDRNVVMGRMTVHRTLHVVSLLSCPHAREIYHTESPSPPGHAVTADTFRDTTKWHHDTLTTALKTSSFSSPSSSSSSPSPPPSPPSSPSSPPPPPPSSPPPPPDADLRSLMDFSQSALFIDRSSQFLILHLLISVCTQFHHLFFFFCRPLNRLHWGLLSNTWLTFLLLSILLTWQIPFNQLTPTNESVSYINLRTVTLIRHYITFSNFHLLQLPHNFLP